MIDRSSHPKRLIKTVLFDWDGTLVDSASLGLIAFQKSFAHLGFEFHQPTYETTYSPNWYAMYERMGLPEEKWQMADNLWMEYYGSQVAELLPGARDTVVALHRNGYQLGIVSSGSECRITRELEHSALREVFSVIVCNEHMTKKKPDPEGIEKAIRSLNSAPEQCCYVGDSPEDIEMGKRANVMTVGVRSSYPTSWKLIESGADIYLESLIDLTSHV